MAGWSILQDENDNPILPSCTALSGRRLELKVNSEIGHPPRTITTSTNSFCKAYDSAVNSIEKWRSGDLGDQDNALDATAKMSELFYKGSECFEAYSEIEKSVIALRFPKNRTKTKEFGAVLKSCRRSWTLACNRIKHNGNAIFPVSYTFMWPIGSIQAFCLLRPAGLDALEVNSDFHLAQERCLPFTIAFRQVLHDLLRVDRAMAALINKIEDDAAQDVILIHETSPRISDSIKLVENWPLWTLDKSRSSVDTFIRNSGKLLSVKVNAVRRLEQGKVCFIFKGDGITQSFPII